MFSNKTHNFKIRIVFMKLVLHTTQFKVSIDFKSDIAYGNYTSRYKMY